MRRVARRVVVFTHDASDPGWRHRFWLTRDYLPEVAGLVAGRPSVDELTCAIGARLEPVLIPWDCADGFFEAYWRRPEAYLDEHVRRAVSVWTRVGPDAEQRAVAASATTFPQAGGPSATVNSSPSTRQSSASVCSWPEFVRETAKELTPASSRTSSDTTLSLPRHLGSSSREVRAASGWVGDSRRRRLRRGGCLSAGGYSHSMVPGGLLVMSTVTRLISSTSLVMRVEIFSSTSYGRRAQSAVMASSLVTGRSTTGCP